MFLSRYEIHVDFESFKDFLLGIKTHFAKNLGNIHKARNEIKVINHQNTDLVVKSFKIPHFLNKIIYTFFRNTKAKKSYEHALKIGNFTPKPIGFIEFYKFGLLDESYFISEKFEYDFTIREPLLDADFPDKSEIFRAFAKFTYDLHESGIYHLDYSPGNILIKKQGSGYIFKLVDINRMKFLPFDVSLRAKNFEKLWAKDEDLKIIAGEYAKLLNYDEKEFISLALKHSQSLKKRKNFKKSLKKLIRKEKK
ncbi:MAG: hypothetical protein GX282_04425 [Campylobacteraceae bacterium]|nr:hypothetical protein [Campylobacteraceae bacterium]